MGLVTSSMTPQILRMLYLENISNLTLFLIGKSGESAHCIENGGERRVGTQRLRGVFGNEHEALPLPLTQGSDSAAFHRREDWESSPDFGVTIE